MKISIIVAMTENRVIGRDNQLPWRLPEDLKRFKAITMGHPIVMGRKTFESIGKVLPGRRNVVVTRNPNFQCEGADVVHGVDQALELLKDCPEIFVIGGQAIFEDVLPKAHRIYLTLIHQDFSGDTYFPVVDLESEFKVIDHLKKMDSQIPHSFITADRVAI